MCYKVETVENTNVFAEITHDDFVRLRAFQLDYSINQIIERLKS
jgi:hypothetical protein